MSVLTSLRPKAANGNGAGGLQAWFSQLNLHWAGVAVLALVNLYLLAQMGFLWHAESNHNASAMEQQRIALKGAEIAAQPLRGLDAKLATATTEADRFYVQRLPGTDSEVAAELGARSKAAGVRWTRAGYTHTPALAGSAGALSELRIDASLSGDYRPLVLFVNSLERDKMFFLITSVTFTGQQTGAVNLRLRMTTYERFAGGQDMPAETETPGGGTGAGMASSAAPTGGPGL